MFTQLLTRRQGPVAYLTLNRPDVRNAFNDELIDELTQWAAAVTDDETIRVAVLAGAGPVFCAGADLRWMASMVSATREANLRDAQAAARMFGMLDALPVPLIGRVQGAAMGGGAGLAAVCDIVVCEREAQFGFTEVRLGILPAIISPFVLVKIGASAARELFISGRRFDAAHAQRIGLVHDVVDPSGLDARIDARVDDVLRGGPKAIRRVKWLLRQIHGRPAGDGERLTAETLAEQRTSEEGQEGLRAFIAKRRASWNAGDV